MPVVDEQFVAVLTNTTPTGAYRGAGRPEAILTIERAIDQAARDLGVDPFDLRRRNFIRTFPYTSATGSLIDCGDFDRVLDRAEIEADVSGVIKAIQVENGQAVEYGQPMFVIG